MYQRGCTSAVCFRRLLTGRAVLEQSAATVLDKDALLGQVVPQVHRLGHAHPNLESDRATGPQSRSAKVLALSQAAKIRTSTTLPEAMRTRRDSWRWLRAPTPRLVPSITPSPSSLQKK